MHDNVPAYGLWSLVIINSAIFIIFAFSFFKPNTARDWRSFSAFSAFLVALFVEMYGFPLTIFLLSGWRKNECRALISCRTTQVTCGKPSSVSKVILTSTGCTF